MQTRKQVGRQAETKEADRQENRRYTWSCAFSRSRSLLASFRDRSRKVGSSGGEVERSPLDQVGLRTYSITGVKNK